MKKYTVLVLALAAVMCMPVFSALSATPTDSAVLIDGKSVSFDAYHIDGNNYFKLRDLAYVLNGSAKQFSVEWDAANNAIKLTSGKPYKAVGGEMAGNKGSGAKTPTPTTSKITKDGKEVNFTAYNIGGNNYFRLRDIAEAFDFNVGWGSAINTIFIDTTKGYMPEVTAKTPELTKDILAIFEGGTFHLKAKMQIQSSDMTYDIYAKYGMASIVMEQEVMGVRRIVYKYGKMYSISDSSKTVTVSEAAPTESHIPVGPNMADMANMKYIGEGSGVFMGKSYKYDEFEGPEGMKIFYFVNGGKLAGIRTTDKSGRTSDMEVLAFDKNVPNSVFEIPSDYITTER